MLLVGCCTPPPELLIAKAPEISIHEAAMQRNLEAVKQHIAAGADVNAKDVNEYTPLDWAIFNKDTETADLLRKHGGKTGEELKAEGK
ncbi:MAG: ankyrin repeat domain-containing protein [Gammaproteobacteria bacterium]|nr:ankyrin repeat domain-containing protein [Gammaproteobacteria bacterium]